VQFSGVLENAPLPPQRGISADVILGGKNEKVNEKKVENVKEKGEKT
jgi:hypothetical protein